MFRKVGKKGGGEKASQGKGEPEKQLLRVGCKATGKRGSVTEMKMSRLKLRKGMNEIWARKNPLRMRGGGVTGEKRGKHLWSK